METLRSQAPTLVAADGGARHVLDAGLMPDAVIGDFDSLSPDHRAQIPETKLHQIPEQDSTDFEKCMLRIAAPLILAAGFMGPRTDHQLATFHGLMRSAHQPCILVGEHQIVSLCPPRLSLEAEEGALISLFPLGEAEARSTGLHWPLEGVPLAPGRMVGTSNRATGGSVSIEVAAPNLLLILQRPMLGALISALRQAPSPWPVREG
ncbi:thiamine diphosphokinase [Aestuariivita boseongensis]|uniref:thiamine diphosphokinase n=1 Tax=Aestuariivita boseongensis TaxID=1470562 RepID=UPI001FE0641D|nr:thiamine diphosphokinase [Aestuariivita boseongensis]